MKKVAPQKSFDSQHRPRVGIALTQGLAFLDKVRLGIVDYAREHGGWTFLFMPEIIEPSVASLRQARIDGAVALVLTAKERQIVRSLPFPVVTLGGHIAPGSIPIVTSNDRGVGQMAAKYFLDLGFKRLGFYGSGNTWYSRERHAGFSSAAKEAGAECNSLLVPVSYSAPDQQRQLERWLRGLQPPVGILASIDMRAAMIVDTCAHLGLRVPDDVAVMGVDNDQFVCEQGPVPITSIVRDDWKVGWEAAAMLDCLMSGGTLPKTHVLIEPARVEARQSTHTIPIFDPFLAGLIADARAHLDKPFGVEWFVERGKCSRRWLEMRFQTEIGQTPLAVINRLRVGKARDMLADPTHESLSLSDIAAQCGFADLRRFRIVFYRHTGMTPKQYRRAHPRPPVTSIE